MSGDKEAPYWPANPSPLLVVQGTADALNPPDKSQKIYQGCPCAKYYLQLLGGHHFTPYTSNATALQTRLIGSNVPPLPKSESLAHAELPVVEHVTTLFFEKELVPSRGITAQQVLAAGNVPGTSTIQAAN
jgi:hypothetical protein